MKTTYTGDIDVDLSGTPATPASNLLGNTDVQFDVDITQLGKQHGHLSLSAMEPDRGPHQLRIPVCVIRGSQSGPVTTVMAGVHGDEHEGSVTINKLCRTLQEQDIHGCLILLPAVNISGLYQSRRVNPADGQNIDYAFPGHPKGSPSERLAYHITRLFIEPCDVLIDLRSGGRHLRFAPSAAMPFNENREQRAVNENMLFAFGAPNSLRLPASAPDSCLQGMVCAMNKHYLRVELGGALSYDRNMLNLAYTGCLNVLRHTGMLSDSIELAATRLLEIRDDSYYIYAPCAGLYEPLTYLGEPVWKTEPMAHLVQLGDTLNAVTDVCPVRDATLIACHPGGFVHAGDLIGILAEEVQG